MRVKYRYVITEINAILGPHSFEYQRNALNSIIKHRSLYEHFKFIGKSTPKLCKLHKIYFYKMVEPYRAARLVHDEKQC